MKSPNEICQELKLKFASRAQMLNYMVRYNATEYGENPLAAVESFKEEIGVKSFSALTDSRLDTLIFEQYEKINNRK